MYLHDESIIGTIDIFYTIDDNSTYNYNYVGLSKFICSTLYDTTNELIFFIK